MTGVLSARTHFLIVVLPRRQRFEDPLPWRAGSRDPPGRSNGNIRSRWRHRSPKSNEEERNAGLESRSSGSVSEQSHGYFGNYLNIFVNIRKENHYLNL